MSWNFTAFQVKQEMSIGYLADYRSHGLQVSTKPLNAAFPGCFIAAASVLKEPAELQL
jgi:hypothetical protein